MATYILLNEALQTKVGLGDLFIVGSIHSEYSKDLLGYRRDSNELVLLSMMQVKKMSKSSYKWVFGIKESKKVHELDTTLLLRSKKEELEVYPQIKKLFLLEKLKKPENDYIISASPARAVLPQLFHRKLEQ